MGRMCLGERHGERCDANPRAHPAHQLGSTCLLACRQSTRALGVRGPTPRRTCPIMPRPMRKLVRKGGFLYTHYAYGPAILAALEFGPSFLPPADVATFTNRLLYCMRFFARPAS